MKFVYAFGLVVSTYLIYKSKKRENQLTLIHGKSKISRFFRLISESFLSKYSSTVFLYSGHAQTFLLFVVDMLTNLFKRFFNVYKFIYKRQIVQLSDGGEIAVDHAIPKQHFGLKDDPNTIMVVIPGYTSSSEEYYIKSFLDEFTDEYECKVMNMRGCSGIKLKTPIMISTYCSRDLEEYIELLAYENENKKIFVVGFSFGGMLLARYLGKKDHHLPDNIVGGCGLCYPISLGEVGNWCESQLGGVYSKFSMANMKKCFNENLDVLFDPELLKNDEILAKKDEITAKVNFITYVSEFDKTWTYQVLNYPTYEAYSDDFEVGQYLENIRIPFLSIFNEDDPIIPIHDLPIRTLKSNSNLMTVVSKTGGHLGFFSGLIPQRWIDRPIITFIKTIEILSSEDDIF